MTTTPVNAFFQWCADNGRLHVARSATTQQVRVLLPDYDTPEDPDEDYEHVFPVNKIAFESAPHFEPQPTNDNSVVIVPLLITNEMIAEIPRAHLPADFTVGAYLNILNLPISRHLITEL